MDITKLKAFLESLPGMKTGNAPKITLKEGTDIAEVYPCDANKLATTEEDLAFFLDIARGKAEDDEPSDEALELCAKFLSLCRELSACDRAWVDYFDYDMEEGPDGSASYDFCELDLVLEGKDMSYVLELDWEAPEE